jgi:hypothetical protein
MRRRLVGGLIAGEPGIAAAEGAHRLHLGDDLVLRAGRLRRANVYVLAVALLFVAGFVELGFQFDGAGAGANECAGRHPRPGDRRVLDVAMGLRTFSGLSVGLLGASIGIHNS